MTRSFPSHPYQRPLRLHLRFRYRFRSRSLRHYFRLLRRTPLRSLP